MRNDIIVLGVDLVRDCQRVMSWLLAAGWSPASFRVGGCELPLFNRGEHDPPTPQNFMVSQTVAL
jgi:hypothetical protein